MFARVKQSRGREYLQIVENYRDGERVRQRNVLYVGHYDSIEDALRQMPDDRRRWRSYATRTGSDSARSEAERLAATLEALRRLVKEHPDLVARDEERATRHRKRQREAMAKRREALRRGDQRRDVPEDARCSEEGCDRPAVWGEFQIGSGAHYLCQTHYDEARPILEEINRRTTEK
jgi:hypothetical protein